MKPLDLRSMGFSEFAFAVTARPGAGDWSILAVPEGEDPGRAAERLTEEVRALGDAAVDCVIAGDDAQEIVRRFEAPPAGVLILGEGPPLSEETLRRLDYARSRLLRDEAVVLVLRLATLQALFRAAPNLASFIQGFVVELAPDAERLSAGEKEARLLDLRARMGRTDAEVVDLATRGELPKDPAFAEWLVLLGHGGLIGRH